MAKSKKLHTYVNKFTGDVKFLSKSQGKHLSEDWGKVELITNDKGERGMRVQLNGATADILEVEPTEVKPDGIKNSK